MEKDDEFFDGRMLPQYFGKMVTEHWAWAKSGMGIPIRSSLNLMVGSFQVPVPSPPMESALIISCLKYHGPALRLIGVLSPNGTRT